MRNAAISMALVLWSLSVATAYAAPTCTDPGVADAAELAIDANNVELVTGLSVSLSLGLTPDSFPTADINAIQDPCSRGAFTANGAQFEMFGDKGNTPPRWAVGRNARRIAYLAVIPDPVEAFAWAQSGAASGPTVQFRNHGYYALAVTDGHRRKIYRILSAVPTDDRLAEEMRDALEEKQPPLATFNQRTGEATMTRR